MAISYQNVNGASYCKIGVDWQASQSNTAVSLAPLVYRYDQYTTDNYGGRFSDAVSNASGGETIHYSLGFGSGSGDRQIDSFSAQSYARKHDAYNVAFWIGVYEIGSYSSGWHDLGSQDLYWNYTVPALTSYAVTFNANGGSGAPAAQTKYYGESLVLPSAIPTRPNYTFVGWGTSASATTATYQPGDTYTANAALPLYAVWKLAALPPSVSVNGYRVASNSATTESPTGGYAYIQVPWSVDTTMVSTNRFSSISANYKKDGGSATSVSPSATQSGTSGTAYFRFTAATGSTFVFTVTVTDTNGVSTTKSLTIGKITYPIYVYDQNKVKINSLTLDNALPVASGGTGSTSAANARSALGVPSKPVVLYDNDSNTGSSVTLSETAANFERLTICFKMNGDANYSSVEVWNPNGKSVSLLAIRPFATNTIYGKCATYTISGTSIALKSGDSPSDFYIQGSAAWAGNQTGNISITQVIGYKSA